MIKLYPLNVFTPNVTAFVNILTQNRVNEIELKHRQPLPKFMALVEELLHSDPCEHVFQTFYLEIPIINFPDLASCPQAQEFKLSMYQDSYFAKGLISASFSTWKRFILWASKQEHTLVVLSNMLYTTLSSHSYFQDLKASPNSNSTFQLTQGNT